MGVRAGRNMTYGGGCVQPATAAKRRGSEPRWGPVGCMHETVPHVRLLLPQGVNKEGTEQEGFIGPDGRGVDVPQEVPLWHVSCTNTLVCLGVSQWVGSRGQP